MPDPTDPLFLKHAAQAARRERFRAAKFSPDPGRKPKGARKPRPDHF